MSDIVPKFQDLEQKVISEANDNNLKQTLKDLSDLLNNEIERNRKNLFFDVKNTLSDFTEKLEKGVSQETEKKISELFEKYAEEVKEEIQTRFEDLLEPIFKKTEENMNRLQIQGNNTLRSWEHMMNQYDYFWTKPFFIMFASSILTGCIIFLVLFFLKTSLAAYMFMDLREKQAYENERYRLEHTRRLRVENQQKYNKTQIQKSNNKK